MKLTFRTRLLLTIAFAGLVCTVAAIWISSAKLGAVGRDGLIAKSQAILSRLEVASAYVATMGTLNGVIKETIEKYPDGNVPAEQKLKVLKSVPVFAALKLGETGAAEEHYAFRVASDHPRSDKNKASERELQIIEQFRANPELKEVIENSPDGQFVLVSRPVRISEARGCLTCHGHPDNSPWKNGKDILGYQMENMKDGDLRGTFTIVSSLSDVKQATLAATLTLIGFGALISFLTIGLGFLIIRRPLASLASVAADLSVTADQVAGMSTQIADTSVQISSGASEQAAALQQTSSSMEQMSAMVERNSDNAQRSQEVASGSQQTAERGKAVVASMIESISEIDKSNTQIMSQVEESNKQMAEIVKVISDIGEKTKVINDIVFQTKLLSFNASVEAARAGEHGKGFAVVAEEVGSLAQMSGNAAQQISDMLNESIHKVEAIVKDTQAKVELLVEEGKVKLATGTSVAHQCGEVLDQIVNSAGSVTSLVAEIATGSREQSKGVSEINSAMGQLNDVTQQNTASSHNASAAANGLSEQADVLRKSVVALMGTLNGDKDNNKAA